MDISGLPPMLPSEMTSILSDEAAVSGLPSTGESDSGPAGAFLDLSASFSAQEQLEIEQLSGSGDTSGAIADLSTTAQDTSAWDPTTDPANPEFTSGADAIENWATDAANPDFWA